MTPAEKDALDTAARRASYIMSLAELLATADVDCGDTMRRCLLGIADLSEGLSDQLAAIVASAEN